MLMGSCKGGEQMTKSSCNHDAFNPFKSCRERKNTLDNCMDDLIKQTVSVVHLVTTFDCQMNAGSPPLINWTHFYGVFLDSYRH